LRIFYSKLILNFELQDEAHFINPKNDGEWPTVKGRREKSDNTDEECLLREISEEFGAKMRGLSTSTRPLTSYQKHQPAI
jgi:hypothetical protein